MKTIVSTLFLAAALSQMLVAQVELALEGRGSTTGPAVQSASAQGAYISFVKSDRKWRLGFRSEPYDKMSAYFRDRLAEALERKGIHQMPIEDGASCCAVSIELLEVTSRPAMVKKPGVDVSATVTITDGKEHPIYAKGFRGESKTLMNTWGHLIDHAIEDMVENVVADQSVLRALAQGQL